MVGLKAVTILLVALLVTSTAIALYEYNQATRLQKEVTDFNTAAYYNEASAYYNEFGVVPSTNVNSSFAPPVSMYRALQIGLDSQGWNKTTLKSTMVYAYLMNWDMWTNNTAPAGITVGDANAIGLVNSPPESYSHTQSDGIVYGYGWVIEVWNSTELSTADLGILGYSLVDAISGQILPTSPVFY